MIQSKNMQSGFTLIEVLLYTMLSGILLLAMSSFFIFTTSTNNKSQSVTAVNEQGIFLMEQITQAVRNASAITAPAVGATGSQLTLVMPNVPANPTIFNISGTHLQVKEGTGVAQALSSSIVQVNDLTFKNVSLPNTPGIVQISFTLNHTNLSGRNDRTYQQSFVTSVSVRP